MVLITASVNFQVHVREEGRARGGGGGGMGWENGECLNVQLISVNATFCLCIDTKKIGK